MSELAVAIERYLGELRPRKRLVAHHPQLRNRPGTVPGYFSPPEADPPAPAAIDAPLLREWLTSLYDRKLDPISIRRKLAAVRSFFQFLLREKSVPTNVARALRTPKAPKRVPIVPTAEQTNTLVDGVAEDKFERPHPERDVALFELLYGCGLRISELVGLNLDDFDLRDRWIRVRGKGRKERQVPYGEKASASLRKVSRAAHRQAGRARPTRESPRHAPVRPRRPRNREVLRAHGFGRRRRCIRIACATPSRRTCSPTAPTCARFRNCWATRVWRRRRSTRRYRLRI